MLVLSRQIDESIIIGEGDDKVEVVIVDVRGDKVRLGIIAPRKISVHHKEIYDAIQREKAAKKDSLPPPPPKNEFLKEGDYKSREKE